MSQRDATRTLVERVKELDCLYAISRMTDRSDFDLDSVLKDVVNVIPAAWQFSNSACARLVVDDDTYESAGFVETRWMQRALVIADGAGVGSLTVCYREPHPSADEGPFLNEERNLLNVLAQRVGEIIERQRFARRLRTYQEQLRSLAWKITKSEERARREMATALHDRVGQTLASARLCVNLAMESDSPAEVSRMLVDAADLLRQAMKDTRTLIFEMSPPILYEVGLLGAIEWAVEQARKRFAFDVELELASTLPEIDEDVASALFQACRELLANAGRHARARRVKARLAGDGDFLVLTVSDDGVGFDVEETKAQMLKDSHFGLFSVRERFEHLGGTVGIDSAPGRGTTVELSCPARVAIERDGGRIP